ncbi:MAG: inositol monophosphatase family protein [Planctomycetota bacterium]|nr:inositol monophosphatase family protein [Planctomycetota bacterium]
MRETGKTDPQPETPDLSTAKPAVRERYLFALDTALRAGRILNRAFHGSVAVCYKSEVDPVTDADIESERYISSAIRERFTTDDIIAEELSAEAETGEVFWLVDPLDGTVNFSHGLPWFAVSIACAMKGKVVVGVVHAPVTGWTFSAAEGHGAWLNGAPIHVSDSKQMRRSIIATGFPYDRVRTRRNFSEHERVLLAAQDVRRMGSAAIDICMTAMGAFDGYYEFGLGPWDFAAGSLVAREAGAVDSQPDGSPVNIIGDKYLCSNPNIHRELVALVSGE